MNRLAAWHRRDTDKNSEQLVASGDDGRRYLIFHVEPTDVLKPKGYWTTCSVPGTLNPNHSLAAITHSTTYTVKSGLSTLDDAKRAARLFEASPALRRIRARR